MVTIEDWQARLLLRIMNGAAFHYSDELRACDRIMSDVETTRAVLEGQVGTIKYDLTSVLVK